MIKETISDQEKRLRRQTLIEAGELIDATKVAQRAGMKLKLAVSPTFFKHFYPYAEDATKGVSWDEIMYEIVKVFKKETGGFVKGYVEFPVIAKTYVKEVPEQGKVKTFSDGRARDKYVTVMVTLMPDENLRPSLVFGVKDYKVMQ